MRYDAHGRMTRVSSVTKVYKAQGAGPATAVDGVSLAMEGGQFLTLMGPICDPLHVSSCPTTA